MQRTASHSFRPLVGLGEVVFLGGLLAGCMTSNNASINPGRDVLAGIREVDLQARFPSQIGLRGSKQGEKRQGETYLGDASPAVPGTLLSKQGDEAITTGAVPPRGEASGSPKVYELNFEN